MKAIRSINHKDGSSYDITSLEKFQFLDEILSTLYNDKKGKLADFELSQKLQIHRIKMPVDLKFAINYLMERKLISNKSSNSYIYWLTIEGLVFFEDGGFEQEYFRKIEKIKDEKRRWEIQEKFHERTAKINNFKIKTYWLVILISLLSLGLSIYNAFISK